MKIKRLKGLKKGRQGGLKGKKGVTKIISGKTGVQKLIQHKMGAKRDTTQRKLKG